jgi:hypothetical protein
VDVPEKQPLYTLLRHAAWGVASDDRLAADDFTGSDTITRTDGELRSL